MVGLQHAHSYMAYLVLFFVGLAAFNALIGWIGKRDFKPMDKTIALLGLAFSHLQMLVGIILYFVSPMVVPIGDAMKNSGLRLYALEHPLINLIAIVLITIGFSKHKKQEQSASKFKTITLLYGIGFILLMSRIPWDNWLN
ncbi:hypothetical protein AB4865_11045 [Capnocytophaga sp. ARDL2]|uniref:hypothetical protein n=1 Tax=Capnocytophaga sp. ARDL2 TaxID=3238809 RepID=UPI003556B938